MSEITTSDEARKAAVRIATNTEKASSNQRWLFEEYINEQAVEVELAINNACSAHMKRIEELEAWKQSAIKVMPDFQAIGNHLDLPVGTDVSKQIIPEIRKLQMQNIFLEKQLLAMREALATIRSKDEEALAALSALGIEPPSEGTTVIDFITEVLRSTPADLASKYSKREVLEKCYFAIEREIAWWNKDGDTCSKKCGTCAYCGLVEALTLARKELEK